MEIGIAWYTFGLVLASLMGGPIAKFLIQRHDLTPDSDEPVDVGIKEERHPCGPPLYGRAGSRAHHSYLHHHRRPV